MIADLGVGAGGGIDDIGRVGGSTGSVMAAVQSVASEFKPGETIVAISPDLGEQYLDTIYDPQWVANYISPHLSKTMPAPPILAPRHQ